MSENSVTMADIANIVKGITAMADGIIREKAEKEMEEKISGKIDTSRRIKIVDKVSAYVRKQVPELLMKIANEQIESSEEDEEERRASQEIEDEIIEKIQPVVNRSIEKAIAEEKIDKLLRTPIEESKLVNRSPKSEIQLSNTFRDQLPVIHSLNSEETKQTSGRQQRQIIWRNAIAISVFHVAAVIAFFSTFLKMKFLTMIWMFACGGTIGFGVTAGAHRLWSHRSYKARLPLKIILLILYSAAGMNSLYDWVRDHRVHHKFSETDADPHNANRGFFFAHVGWLMQRKHPKVIQEGKKIDMSDIANDPLLRFHTKYFLYFKILMCFVLPIWVPMYFWQECFLYAFCSQALLRYMWTLNVTWAVNSFAHIWGSKPYDKRIQPVENVGVSIVALGEGWHNYHHSFPWDYRTAELLKFNATTLFLNFFSKIGLAYDMRTASPELVDSVSKKHGDGSRFHEVPSEFADIN